MEKDGKQKPVGFKVIKGGGQGPEKARKPGKRPPLFFILLFFALFLPAQILIGWIWGMFDQGSVHIISVGEGSIERTFGVSGIVTFEEEIIFSPRSGFVHYLFEEGSRVPAGAELVRICDFPPVEAAAGSGTNEEDGPAEYFVKFKEWFYGNEPEDESDPSCITEGTGTTVVSPQAGLVSLSIDGWEEFGPGQGFPYFTEEEFNERSPQILPRNSGLEVVRSFPLLRVINNYTWYFSAVLPASLGETIAERSQVLLYFSLSPECPVSGELIEVRKKGENVEITWAISQYLKDLYNLRWCQAEIVYEQIEGTMIPRSTLIEKDDKKGVYIIKKGIISFCEVQVLGEEEEFYLVDNLESYENVILNPDKKKEGQRFTW